MRGQRAWFRRIPGQPSVQAAGFIETVKIVTQQAEDLAKEPQDPQEKLTARIIGMCNQTGDALPITQRLGAREMLDEVKTLNMDNALTRADLEYLQGKGYHKTVTSWAAKELAERVDSDPSIS